MIGFPPYIMPRTRYWPFSPDRKDFPVQDGMAAEAGRRPAMPD